VTVHGSCLRVCRADGPLVRVGARRSSGSWSGRGTWWLRCWPPRGKQPQPCGGERGPGFPCAASRNRTPTEVLKVAATAKPELVLRTEPRSVRGFTGQRTRAHGRMTDRDHHRNDQKQSPRISEAYERIRPSGSVNRCLRFLARAIRPRDRAHDRGRCPLYVRAQLDTVGLSWTQRDLVRPKATAREAGKIQLTGYFRRWWQVLGSNQRRLSRRFYRPLPLAARATCLAPPVRRHSEE
jgi:hypothetical protein